jgi:hypothetical protein
MPVNYIVRRHADIRGDHLAAARLSARVVNLFALEGACRPVGQL